MPSDPDDPTLASSVPASNGPDADVTQSQTLPSVSLPHIVPAQPVPVAASSAQSDGVPTVFPRIDGYHVIAKLGQGGMGAVYRATQLATRREVALKLMSVRALGSDKARRRFEREVELASSLEHPNIARVFDSGLAKNIYFYAMQLVPGVPLDKHVEMNQLDERAILEVFLKVCRAVEFAHRKGVIHRDLKPSNIVVTPEGDPFVLDFGLAKTLVDDGEHLTVSQEGDLTGTPAYMSPEQAAGHVHSIDTRTDVYALGVILFRLLTNDHPHDTTGSAFDLTKRIIELDPKRPRNIKANLDRDLEAIVLKCLEKQPSMRYGSAGGLAEDIERYLRHEPISAQPATATYYLKKKLARHKPLVALVAVLFVVFNAAVLFYFWSITAEQTRTEKARQEAITQKGVAETNANTAEQQRVKAVAAEKTAEQERDRARDEAEATRRANYFNLIRLVQAEQEDGNVTRASELLDSTPPDLRDWEWAYLRRVTEYPMRELRGISQVAEAAAWSPDGRLIAASSSTGQVLCFDAETGQVVSRYAHNKGVSFLRFHPNGDWIASAGDDAAIHIWNPRDGSALRQIEFPHPIQALDVSADGKFLAAGTRDTALVKVWETSNWNEIAQVPVKITTIVFHGALAFSPDSATLAIAGTDGVQLWSLRPQPQLMHRFSDVQCHSLMFSPDGNALYGSDQNGFLFSWDLPTGAQRFAIHSQSKHALGAISPDGKLVATAFFNNIRLHDSLTGRTVRLIRRTGSDSMRRPFFSPDGKTVGVVDLDRVRLWKVDNVEPFRRMHSGDMRYGRGMAISPDGNWLTARYSSRWGIWRLPNGEPHRFFTFHYYFGGLDFSSDSRQLLTLHDGRVFQMAMSSREVVPVGPKEVTIYGTDAAHLACAVDGSVAIANSAGELRLWRAADQSPVWSRTLSSIRSISFSHDGRLLFYGTYKSLHVLRSDTGETLKTLPVPGNVRCAAFNKRGDLLAVGSQHALTLFDWPSAKPLWSDQAHDSDVLTLHWNPQSTRFVTAAADGRVMIWSPHDSQPLLVLKNDGPVGAAYFDHEGNAVYSASGGPEGGIRRWPTAYRRVDAKSSIDLLAGLAGTDQSAQWKRGDQGSVTMSNSGRAQLPAVLLGNYEIHAEFVRTTRTGLVALMLPVGEGRCAVEIDHPDAHLNGSCLSLIDGKSWRDLPTYVPGMRLTTNQRHTVLARVKLVGDQADIAVELDSKPLLTWKGSQRSLDVWEGWRLPQRDGIGLGVFKGDITWHSVKLKMLNGEAWVRNAETDPARGELTSTVKPGAAIDLLALVNMDRDRVGGDWKMKTDELTVEPAKNARLQIPCTPSGSYELTGAFTADKLGQVVVMLPTNSTRGAVLFNSPRLREGQRSSGIEMIDNDGVGQGKNPATAWGTIAAGIRHEFRIVVKQGKDVVDITVELDGKPLTQWRGPESTLSLWSEWETLRRNAIGIGALDTAVTWHALKLTMLDGEAWVREPVKPDAPSQPEK